jgi:hypothetical protein
MLNVKITIDDGKGKKAELELNEDEQLPKLVIIQNVFKLFGIDNDLLDQIKTFDNASKAYSSFFSETIPVEPEWIKEKATDTDIRQKLIESYEQNRIELQNTYKETKDQQPEFVRTGIKINNDGTKRYKLYYICSKCDHTGNHYIYDFSKHTWCHSCKFEMLVYPATPDYLTRDTKGNFFRAGEYKDINLAWTIG